MGGILDMGKIEMTDEYVRVGTTLYKIVFQPLINGTFAKRRVPWSMGTLRYDHGKDFIASVPKYDGFCTVPSHVDYKRNIGSFLNLYEPITHTPQKGKFPHIQELILHIFGEHYELGMDYFQLLYLNPVQKLPILLLVSQERNTGKSTFLNFLKAIFQDNVTFNTNEDFRSQFYNPQIQISAESETKRSIFREKDKTKRSKKESAQHSKSRNKSFVMTSVSAL